MNYKKIIKSQKLRLAILDMLCWIPDKPMIKFQYRIKTDRKLDLNNPKRYTEKIQWYKLNYKNPLMISCCDKYDVREYVEEKGLSNILNDCYGVYDNPNEIDFDKLPNEFVLKDTLGSGGSSIIICKDKKNANIEEYKRIMNEWISKKNKPSAGREWPYYSGKKHRIIAEELLNCKNGDLPDYKFFCFSGEPYCLYMMQNYRENHANGELSFLSKDFKLLDVCRADFKPITEQPEKPKNYEKMIEYSRILSKGFPHVRVDFYNIEGKIIFGEMTFFNASGYFSFKPDSFDFELGEKFIIDNQ